MSFSDQLPAIAVSALSMSLLFDILALPLGYADRRGYTLPFKVMKRYVSNVIGFMLLCICVPGAILSLMVCFVRSWADDNVVFAVLFVFLAGAVLGFFLSSDPADAHGAEA